MHNHICDFFFFLFFFTEFDNREKSVVDIEIIVSIAAEDLGHTPSLFWQLHSQPSSSSSSSAKQQSSAAGKLNHVQLSSKFEVERRCIEDLTLLKLAAPDKASYHVWTDSPLPIALFFEVNSR